MRQILFLLFSFGIPLLSVGQKVQGTIRDAAGSPVKYATIYIEQLQTGTSANDQGAYILNLRPGKYTLEVRSLGFAPTRKTLTVASENIHFDITMDQQSYVLMGVTVRTDNEDPAYTIMRNAIARAPAFANQVQSYTSEVYIKGAVTLHKLPRMLAKRMEVNGEKPKEGETYVNESINKITYQAPDNYRQEVISVNNSFPIGDNDVPVIGLLSGSIYQSQDDFYISPFAPNAFAHYKFSYEGLLQDGAFFINKIKVTPKRKSKLLMSGFLYIVDEMWCLYSYDITLKPLYTSLQIKQYYAPVKGDSYLPVNMFAEADIKVMGIEASATYTSTIKYSDVILNPDFTFDNFEKQISLYETDTTAVEEPVEDPKIQKIDTELEELLSNNNPSNRDMVQMQKLMNKKASILEDSEKEDPLLIESHYQQIVSKDALVRDSTYWDSIRPVPASANEKISYKKREEKKAEIDSTPAIVKVLETAAFGNYEWERSKKHYVYYPGLFALRNVGFHPVDGWQFMQHIKYRWNIDSTHVFETKGMVGYAFSRESFFAQGQFYLDLFPLKRARFRMDYGYGSRDFNRHNNTPKDINMLYNLLLKENYIKQYHDTYVLGNYNFDIRNGLRFDMGFAYSKKDSLVNRSNFSFVYPDKAYDPNHPVHPEVTNANLSPQEQITYRLALNYTPKQPYEIRKGKKHMHRSKYPTFSANYTGNIPLTNNPMRLGLLELGIHQYVDIYSISSFDYMAQAGLFIQNEGLHFSNYKHFKTFTEPFSVRRYGTESFFLLKNYEYSTAKKYFQLHTRYSNQYILLKRLPYLSNTMWDENLYASFLTVEGRKPYLEVGYTMSEILFMGEVGVFAGFKGQDFYGIQVRGTFVFR